MFENFETHRIPVPGATIHVRTAGRGEPLLLLHGFPQTHAMWHRLGPALARGHRVVVADLRGYGESTADSEDFSFRAMAADMVAVMRHLGHESFHVVAHDRGARTAHRMTLDAPDAVRSVALLDILPTPTVWELMDDWLAIRYYHWLFLAQPAPMPQGLISAEPLTFLHATLGGLSGTPGSLDTFDPEALVAYEAAARNPSVVAAWCADYAAAAGVDREHDDADRGTSRDLPALLLWGSNGVVGAQTDPLEAWRPWLPRITGRAVPTGHFMVEERPDEVLAEIQEHLAAAAQN